MKEIIKREELLLLTLESFLEISQDMIFVKDLDLNYVDTSQSFADLLGVNSKAQIIGKNDYDVFPAELAKRYIEDDRRILEIGKDCTNILEPIPGKDGRKSYSSTSKHLIRNEKDEIIGLYGIARDVTSEIELEEEKEQRELSRQMFEDVLEADLSENKMLRAEGSVWAKTLGVTKGHTFVETVQAFAAKFIHKDYAEEFKNFYTINKLASDYEKGKKEFSHITYQSKDGIRYKWIEFKSRVYFSRVSNTLRITTFLKDLDDEIKAKEKLKKKAETDPLTGLLNRESVINRINECITEEFPEKMHALLFIDLDGFKQVNDNMGHLFGDKILMKTGEKLKFLFEEQNIVGRIGGDEFLVFLKDVSSEKEIEGKVNSIFETVPYYQFKDEQEVYVTCSIGVSIYQGDGKKVEELYDEADNAMYRAKNQGKNQMAFFNAS